jgi:hypothetical protein
MAKGFEGHHSTPWAVFRDNRRLFEEFLPASVGWVPTHHHIPRMNDPRN